VADRQTGLTEALRAVVRSELGAGLAEMHRFVDRRIAELSAEIHGAVQMVDFSEANLSGQLARIHEQVAGLIAVPALATRNSGIELQAVVEATETAANRILEAAEVIADWVQDGARDPARLDDVAIRVNAIFEACSFQDLTGQRIRRAIAHLQRVESLLDGIMHRAPPAVPALPPAEAGPGGSGIDLAQSDIDRLLA
jgi:chemotaxis protein CheZ